MRESVITEDTPDGLFISSRGSRRKIAKLIDPVKKEADAHSLVNHINSDLIKREFIEQSLVWLRALESKKLLDSDTYFQGSLPALIKLGEQAL